jgi:outer membrane receptor protein involved in Fe transport
MNLKLLTCLAVVFSIQAARAQVFSPGAEAPLLDTLSEVVVTAQRFETQRFETPASLEKLTQKRLLDRQERTAPEALMTTPGVFVQKTNHGGGSPFLRGLTGNQTLLLVDGIRLSNATFRYGPNQYLNTIDPFSIQNIEALKGGGSVGYGSDALGGTINVLTQSPDFQETGNKWSGKALTLWRNRDMEKTAHLESHFAGKNMALRAAGSLRQFGDLAGGDTTGVQSPSGYEETAFDLKGRFRLGENAALTLAHQFLRQADVPVFHKIQLENFARNHMTLQRRQLSYARLEASPDGGSPLQKITATASLHRSDERRESQKNGSAILRKEADEVRSLGFSAQAELKISAWWRSTAGVETYHDLVGSTRSDVDTGTGSSTAKRGLYPDGATHLSNAVFCTNNWESGDWNFTGGLRFNHFSIKVEDENIGEAHLKPTALVWNAGALRKFGNADAVFVSFNTAFRAPNVDDLGSLGIVDFRYELPTADLKPEKSHNFELGWRHRAEERWQLQTAVFRNELRNLITRVRVGTDSIAGYPVYRKENVQEGYIHGIETSGNVLIVNNLHLEGALAWQYGQNVTADEPLRRIPPVFGRMALHFSKKNGQVTLENLFAATQDRLAAGDKSDNRIPAGGTPGWQIWNLYGSYSWKWLKLRAGFWNILNEDYRYHGSGVNGAGRSVTVGATVNW